MSYGYLHRGRVIELDVSTGGYVVEIPTLAPSRRMGPFPSLVPNLPAGQRIVLASMGTSRDDLVIVGRVPGVAPTIGQIPGLQAALDGKADDSEITALDGRVDTLESGAVSLDSRVDTLESGAVSLDGRLDVLEALSHVRMVAALTDVTSPVSNQLVWLLPERRFYRWDTAPATDRWSLSASPGQVIGGKRRVTDASATSGTTELAVLDTGGHNFEQNSVYLIKAFLSWQASSGGNDFLFRIREGTTTSGTQWAQTIVPRTDDGYPYQNVVEFMRVTAGAESTGLAHAVTAQRIVGSGTCTVYAGSYMTVTYLGPVGFIDTV